MGKHTSSDSSIRFQGVTGLYVPDGLCSGQIWGNHPVSNHVEVKHQRLLMSWMRSLDKSLHGQTKDVESPSCRATATRSAA